MSGIAGVLSSNNQDLIEKMLQKIHGGSTKIDCRTLLKPHPWIEIIGPVLIEEGLKVLEGYQFGK